MTLLRARPHHWTVTEFERLVEQGFLGRNPRVELIEGEIFLMGSMNTPHGDAIMHATNLLVELFGRTHWVRVQCPINLTELSQPEPDFALVRKDSVLVGQHPSQADLIIEVSDSSLVYDRDDKGSLYARASVADYWIINVVERRLEVYRKPQPQPSTPFGFAYQSVTSLVLGQTVFPLFAPDTGVSVSDLL